MTLTTERHPEDHRSSILVVVDRTLDPTAWEALGPALSEARRGRRPLVLDLSRCSSIDSFGLRVIFRVYRELSAGDPSVPMAIVLGDPATRLISPEAIGMTIPLFPGREQALAWIESLREAEASAGLNHDAAPTSDANL